MRIISISFADSAGAAYTLSHALNKHGHKAINLRSNNNYINYPTIANMADFDRSGARKLIEKSDVVIFHTTIQPFFSALEMTPELLKDKKKLLYFHGSDLRNYGPDILKQADKYLMDYEVLVSTPDLLRNVPDGHWMPVCRSFSEISKQFMPSKRDKTAFNAFGSPRTRLVLSHAPTSTDKKGTSVFNRCITRVLEVYEHARYVDIQNVPWDSCLRTMGQSDIFFDQCKLGAYGMAAVEASIFKIPVFCLLDDGVLEIMELESEIKNPFIQWTSEDMLAERIISLLANKNVRKELGTRAYEYCKKMHDEKPIVQRLIKIINEMPG